jgi:hypothetical protein
VNFSMSDSAELEREQASGNAAEGKKRLREATANTAQGDAQVRPKQPPAERTIPAQLAAAFGATVEHFGDNPEATTAALKFIDACQQATRTPTKSWSLQATLLKV